MILGHSLSEWTLNLFVLGIFLSWVFQPLVGRAKYFLKLFLFYVH